MTCIGFHSTANIFKKNRCLRFRMGGSHGTATKLKKKKTHGGQGELSRDFYDSVDKTEEKATRGLREGGKFSTLKY